MLPSVLQDVKWLFQGDASSTAVVYPEMELIAVIPFCFPLTSLSALNLSDTTQFRVLRLSLFRAEPCVVNIYSAKGVVLLNKSIHFRGTHNWKKLLRTSGNLPSARYRVSAGGSGWGLVTWASQKELLPERIQPGPKTQETNSLLLSTALCWGSQSHCFRTCCFLNRACLAVSYLNSPVICPCCPDLTVISLYGFVCFLQAKRPSGRLRGWQTRLHSDLFSPASWTALWLFPMHFQFFSIILKIWRPRLNL